MNFLSRRFRKRQKPFLADSLSHDYRAWQRNDYPRFKPFFN